MILLSPYFQIRASQLEPTIIVERVESYRDLWRDYPEAVGPHMEWPKHSENGRIDADGTVHVECVGCSEWFPVIPRMVGGFQAMCPHCYDGAPDSHNRCGTGKTALEAAQEYAS